MELKDLRNEIDAIDDQLVKLFAQRMEVSAQIAGYKKEKSLPIFVPAREREKLADVAEKAGPDMANYTRVLYSMLFELSRSYQSKLTGEVSPLYREITEAIETTPKLFPQAPMVACQGVEGAYSQIACAQTSINLKTMEEVTLEIKGRHDPCIVPRAVPVVEAAAAIAIYDLLLGNTQTSRRK